MTVQSERTWKWCGDCFNFDKVICDTIGVCVEIRSEHNRHLLEESHPACSFWKKRP